MTPVVSLIGQVVEAMRDAESETPNVPYYLYGHKIELEQRLITMSKDSAKKFEKYPLVALNMDFPERLEGGLVKLKLNIAILASTNKDFVTPDRYANVFTPILYPLYDGFFEALTTSGLFTWDSAEELPKHIKYDRPFWGTIGKNGNEANIFSDPLDAIELVDLEINYRNKNC